MSSENNPYHNRWQWWYSSIIDWMIANPGRPLQEATRRHGGPIHCAPNTLYMITNTDLFKSHLAKRKAEFRDRLDMKVIGDASSLHEMTQTLIMEELEKKRTSVPIETLLEVQKSALEILGYGPKQGPSVVVQNQVDTRVAVAVDANLLEECRQGIRRAEMNKTAPLIEATPLVSPPEDVDDLDDTLLEPISVGGQM